MALPDIFVQRVQKYPNNFRKVPHLLTDISDLENAKFCDLF